MKVRIILYSITLAIYIILCRENIYAGNNNTIELKKITDSVWVHVSYKDYNGNPYPSNGLIVITSGGVILIDTPYNNAQMQNLLEMIHEKFNDNIILAIVTHAHDDRIGGIETLLKNKTRVISSEKTANLASLAGYPKPESISISDTSFRVGNTKIELYYPGWGHTPDNIVAWLPASKILFGGCLIKSETSQSLGNIAEANIEEWKKSIRRVMDKFNDCKTAIPGHGEWGNKELLKHTLKLLENSGTQK